MIFNHLQKIVLKYWYCVFTNAILCVYLYKEKQTDMTNQQTKQHSEFKAAKQIALTIKKGCLRRATHENVVTNYCGFKSNDGKMWVIGDTDADIQNPDAIINGKPAREVFGDFTVMSR